MIEQNKKIFDYINLTQYHNRGFTGKGTKGFVLEPKGDHRIQVIKSLLEPAFDCEILTTDGRTENNYADMIINSGANFVTCSYTLKYMEPSESKRLIDAGISLFVAIGNKEGLTNKITELAKDDNWISVGAVNLKNNIPVIFDYSSQDMVIDTVSFVPYIQTSLINQPQGTSFSTPFLAGQFACYFQYFKDKYGRFPTPKEAIIHLQSESLDLGDIGVDINFGNGLWIMPNIENIFIRLQINNIKSYLNGVETILDTAPIIDNNRTLIPIRFVAESIGAMVEWDGITKLITISQNSETTIIKLTIGSKIAYVNGKQVILDVEPKIVNSRTLIPLRFVSENLGCKVEWIESSKTIIISK